jgi:hypothetical protein
VTVAPGSSASSVVPLGFDKKSLDAYQVAMRLSSTHLEPTHPTRLGLCLNYSVLLYEVSRNTALSIALTAQSGSDASQPLLCSSYCTLLGLRYGRC